MRASLKIFTWLGIPVYLHWSFALILLFPAITFVSSGFSWMETLFTGLIMLTLFGCVLLHEYGHAIMARRFGVSTRDIILTPIGGIARLERMPEQPVQEILVALAGPMVNVVIAIVLLLVSRLALHEDHWLFFQAGLEQSVDQLKHYFLDLFMQAEGGGEEELFDLPLFPSYLLTMVIINAMLVIFNLIPAFPMDGGRVLRALLAMQFGRVKATRLAAYIGQGMAILFFLVGIFKGPQSLLLIGVFIFMTARSESAMVQMDDFLSRFTARDLVRRHFTRLNTSDWMLTPIDMLYHSLEKNFLVFDVNEKLVGVLEETQILEAERRNDRSASVAAYTHRVEAVSLHAPLQQVYQLIQMQGHGLVVVADEYGIQGVIDEAGLEYFIRMRKG